MSNLVLSVDLAAKFSASCLMDLRDHKVHRETNSLGKSSKEWAQQIARDSAEASILLIEDIPHSVVYRVVVKDACRLQGRILQELESSQNIPSTLFIQPQLWQKSFDGVYRGGVKGAKAAADRLGYSPPNLVENLHGKERADARKVMTDHVDAYLMAYWFVSLYKELGSVKNVCDREKRISQYGEESRS